MKKKKKELPVITIKQKTIKTNLVVSDELKAAIKDGLFNGVTISE